MPIPGACGTATPASAIVVGQTAITGETTMVGGDTDADNKVNASLARLSQWYPMFLTTAGDPP